MKRNGKDTRRGRREAPRAALETRATVHLVNQEFTCQTRDLSPQGVALVGHDSPVPPGTFMRVQLKLPNQNQFIDLDGVLVRATPESSGMVWGLKLVSHEADALAKIEEYVGKHASTERPKSGPQEESPLLEPPPANGAGFTSISSTPSARPKAPAEPAPATREAEPRDPQNEDQYKAHPDTSPDSQFFQLYEEAMAKASVAGSAAGEEPHLARNSEPRAPEPRAPGRGADLNAELQRLYEETAGETPGTDDSKKRSRWRSGFPGRPAS